MCRVPVRPGPRRHSQPSASQHRSLLQGALEEGGHWHVHPLAKHSALRDGVLGEDLGHIDNELGRKRRFDNPLHCAPRCSARHNWKSSSWRGGGFCRRGALYFSSCHSSQAVRVVLHCSQDHADGLLFVPEHRTQPLLSPSPSDGRPLDCLSPCCCYCRCSCRRCCCF